MLGAVVVDLDVPVFRVAQQRTGDGRRDLRFLRHWLAGKPRFSPVFSAFSEKPSRECIAINVLTQEPFLSLASK
jgi:hypothetical protein